MNRPAVNIPFASSDDMATRKEEIWKFTIMTEKSYADIIVIITSHKLYVHISQMLSFYHRVLLS